MKRVGHGFSAFFRGIKLWLHNRRLFLISLFPLFISFALFLAGMTLVISRIAELRKSWSAEITVWYQNLYHDFTLFFVSLSLILLVVFGAYIIGNLLSFPFNDALAERTLKHLGASLEKSKSLKQRWQNSLRNSGAMFRRTLILLTVGTTLFLITLLPGLGLIAAAAGAFILATDRMDYSFDQYSWTFKQRVSFVKSHLPEIIGFSLALGLTSLVPVINILTMPGSIVSGAILFSELKKDQAPFERPHP